MLVYNGKENYAKVFIDIIDEATVSQIFEFINHPALKGTKIRIMPDCHAGKGCVVGTTIDLKNCNYIIPNMVGVDIGCGIISYNLGKEAGDKLKNDEDFKAFYDFLKVTIPTGFNVHKDMKYIDKDRYSQIEKNGIEKVCDKIDYDFNRAKLSIGTLGGGNHFIELNKDDEDNIWLTIHTGSRGFGESVCRYHQKKAEGLIKDMYFGASAYKGAEFLLLNNGGNEYLKDMKVAQYYASLNRYVIAELILPYFNITVDKYYTFKPKVNFVESVHNYIDFNTNILRKGAISAQIHEKVVIPLNQEDGVIIGKGKGNVDWNFSAPHGAGRIMSRKKAKEAIQLDDVKESMKNAGVYSGSISQSTIDEAKAAYKDPELIIEAIGDSVYIEFIMKPIFNFKDEGKSK